MALNPFASFQIALVTEVDSLEAMCQLLPGLIQSRAVREIEVRTKTGGPIMSLLGCGNSATAFVLRPRLPKIFEGVKYEQIDIDALKGDELNAFIARAQGLTVRASTGQMSMDQALSTIRRTFNDTPVLRVEVGSAADLANWWSKHLADGAIWTASSRPPTAKELKVTLVCGSKEFPGLRGTTVPRAPPSKTASGFWLTVEASKELREFLEKYAREQKQGRRSPPVLNSDRRTEPRYETLLDVEFETGAEFAVEYASNISKGGMFVRCQKPPALRSKINIHMKLPSDKHITLQAEVVHVVPPELSSQMNMPVGVGVQFTNLSPEVREQIEGMLAQFEQRAPKVLIVDPDAKFRAEITEKLRKKKVDVSEAADGKEALVRLIDGLFELDLVVANLEMPNLDGRGLVERIRTAGGEAGLRIALLANGKPGDVGATPGASAVLSKQGGIDTLVAAVLRELGHPS